MFLRSTGVRGTKAQLLHWTLGCLLSLLSVPSAREIHHRAQPRAHPATAGGPEEPSRAHQGTDGASLESNVWSDGPLVNHAPCCNKGEGEAVSSSACRVCQVSSPEVHHSLATRHAPELLSLVSQLMNEAEAGGPAATMEDFAPAPPVSRKLPAVKNQLNSLRKHPSRSRINSARFSRKKRRRRLTALLS
jgi:hypothetical protein